MRFYPEPKPEAEPVEEQPVICRTDFLDRICKLVHKDTQQGVPIHGAVTCFRDDPWIIVGGSAPHKASSQGKVFAYRQGHGNVHSSQEMYPSVFGLEWVHDAN